MDRIKTFIKTSILGGLVVILPAILLLLIFRWLFNGITGIIQPFTNLMITKGHFPEAVADVLVIGIILVVCFLLGVVVKTKAGLFLQENVEKRILQLAPGYPTIKSIVMQFIGKKKSPFSSVALVQVFQKDILMTAFITDTHENGRVTVFVPTGPNPTTGFIFHLPQKYVHPIGISVQEALRSVISCGAGSTHLLNMLEERVKES